MLQIPQKPLASPTSTTAHTGQSVHHRPVGVPYVKGLSEQLQRLFKKQNINIYHQPWNTLRQRHVHPKDQVEIGKKCDVVYQIQCSDCDSTYVGETSRSFATRFKEHTKIMGNNLSAVGEHIACFNHNISMESCKILDSTEGFHSRKIKEALFIQEVKPNLNRDGGFELPRIYGELLSRGRGSRRGHVTGQ